MKAHQITGLYLVLHPSVCLPLETQILPTSHRARGSYMILAYPTDMLANTEPLFMVIDKEPKITGIRL